MNVLKLGLFGFVASAVACGGGGGSGGVVSCAGMASVGSSISVTTCQEFPTSEAAQVKNTCMSSAVGDSGITVSAQFSNGPCSRTGAVGGCMVTEDGATATTWYYRSTPRPS